LLAYLCVPKNINLIDNHLFGGSFLPSILVNTNPRHPATISPSLVLNRTELIEIPTEHYKLNPRHRATLKPPIMKVLKIR